MANWDCMIFVDHKDVEELSKQIMMGSDFECGVHEKLFTL